MNYSKRSVKMSEEKKCLDNNLPLPPDKMPECWEQDERMSSLFSPLRSRSANPQDWISKTKFWQSFIYDWLKYSMHCAFCIADLNQTFKRKGCTPHCLTEVVEELVRNNEVILESEFMKEPCESWTAWSIDIFVKKPITWSFSKVKSYIVSDTTNLETRYIHLKILRELGDIILSILETKKENILVPVSEIIRSCNSNMEKNITDDTVMLALIWLKRAKRVSLKNDTNQNELLVKIITRSTNDITQVEESLYQLMKQENELENKIELMEKEKINILNQTKSLLAKGMRQVAKTHLRKKIELEKAIEKQACTLDNLRSLILSIQDTHSNTAVLSAYKIGSDVLKKLNESGLSESNVRDIVDDLSTALEEQKEVQSILSETIKSNESDTDLEQELEELLMLDESVFPATPSQEPNSQVDELERNMANLHVADVKTSNEISTEHSSNISKKSLTKPQYA